MSILRLVPRAAVVLLVLTQTQACGRATNSNTDTTTGAASSASTSSAITDVEWSLVDLNGQPAGTGAGGKPATLLLATQDTRASGFAGCNRLGGTYTLAGTALSFNALMMTRMACSQGMDLETRYSAALGTTRTYRATEKQLELMVGDTVLARFTRP